LASVFEEKLDKILRCAYLFKELQNFIVFKIVFKIS